MRPIPRNTSWEEIPYNNPGYGAFEPYPVAGAEEWFFTSLGLSRGKQAGLTLLAGAAGVIAGLVGLAVLMGAAGSPSGASVGLVGWALVTAVVGFGLGAAAFYAIRESADYAEIEACRLEVKAAAAVSIISGGLVIICLALAFVGFVVAFFILRTAAED